MGGEENAEIVRWGTIEKREMGREREELINAKMTVQNLQVEEKTIEIGCSLQYSA